MGFKGLRVRIPPSRPSDSKGLRLRMTSAAFPVFGPSAPSPLHREPDSALAWRASEVVPAGLRFP
mgnify:CR=1 FL=1